MNQIAPDAIRDEQTIERTALARMNGPEPCPDRILPRRARDSKDILLVETTRLSSLHLDPYGDGQYRIASFRLVKAIKGSVGRPLANVRVDQGIWQGSAQIHNSAIDLLRPGQRLLLVSGYNDSIDEFCEVLAASPSAIQTIIDNLPQLGPAIAKEHPEIQLPPPQ
ncbi:MAG TPA: hypothetical protein VFQ43_20500 [Nitrososphaera sp.]|nr:hypothetical protein [Nitrososphaera sp.]